MTTLTLKDLVDQANRTGPIDLEFAAHQANQYGVEDLESYPEAGMRVRLTGGHHMRDDTTVMELDFSPFEDHNQPLETATFYPKSGDRNNLVTARASGHYKPQDTAYVPSSLSAAQLVSVIDGPRLGLLNEWKTAGSTQSYTAFLEQQVLALRAPATPALTTPAEVRPRRRSP